MTESAAEIKAQAVQELARDPQSNVTSDDLQKVIVDEGKKAGVAAFRFDPNATPEQKAAVAEAAIPPELRRRQAPHAIGIATDMTNAPDKYDLPPPTASGAIAPVPFSPTHPGQPNAKTIDQDEKKAFEQKTGWAPRFGYGDLTSDEANASLLDHQTFLEARLDENLYGDWYHNAAIIIFASLSSWVVAILGGGLGWIFIIMATCSTYYRTSLRRVRRNIKDDIRRELAIAKLSEDVESTEWINSFLYRFWPIYQPILAQTVINSVDQVLSTSTPAFLESLRLSMFTLGSKPPRIEHVKTYPKDDDESLTMEWKFSFTPNDTTDMTARQKKNKQNPKVVLEVRVGKGIVSKGIDVIVENMSFSGTMKLKLKFQLPFPHIEKVDMCFTDRPDIDYVCKPLGGDTLGFDINFIPGLEGFIKEQIHANLAPIMYAPHVFPIEIAKILAGSPVDQAIGVVAVTIHGCQGLKNPDNFAGNPDPYIVASLNHRAPLGKTKTVRDTPNPRFNETIYVIVTSLTDTLTLQVFDWNEFRKDKDLGTASFPLEQLEQITDFENSQLEVIASGNKKRGIVQADIRYFPVLHGLTLADGTIEPPPESNTGIARLTVEQAKDLDGSKSMVGQLSPYAELLLNGQPIHVTDKRKRTNQPIWVDNAKDFLVTDRKSARLAVVIKDEKDLGTHPIIGKYQIRLEDMLKGMEKGQEWYSLAGATTGRVKLLLQWKPVELRNVLGAGTGYLTPIGVMRLHFQNAKDLRNVETMGKSDPYVRVLLSGIEKGRTVTFDNNLNPEFDEVIYVPIHSPREHLALEVMDYQKIGKDRSLGLFELPVADYVQEGPGQEYLVHDAKSKVISAPLKMLGKGSSKGTLNFTASFYPTIPTIDPEEEEAEKKDIEAVGSNGHTRTSSRPIVGGRLRSPTQDSISSAVKTSIDMPRSSVDSATLPEPGKINTTLSNQPRDAEMEVSKQQPNGSAGAQESPKLRLNVDDLSRYETGLLVFRLMSGEFSRTDFRVEVIMDDFSYPSFVSSKVKSRSVTFGETGDAIVREIDVSRITVRLVEKSDKNADDEKHVLAKLSGDLLPVLRQCLYTEAELSIGQGADGGKIKVLMKYIPIKMQLDPSESMNNMGNLRVEVLDARGLPSADSNGFSDPYCKFELNGDSIFKTKTIKKTLNPNWGGEHFETSIKSRTAAKLRVKIYDWDQFGDDDFLGEAGINLEHLDPMLSKNVQLTLDGAKGPGSAGVLNLRLLFKAAYVTRSRQGSSTFSGSINVAGKVVGAPVKIVGKVGGGVGGGIVKGASFMKHSLKGSKDSTNHRDSFDSPDTPIQSIETGTPPPRTTSLEPHDNMAMGTPSPRAPSMDAPSITGISTAAASEIGVASISVVSATGYPSGTKIQVVIKAVGSKHSKELLKTKAIKNSGPESNITWDNESTTHKCTPDTQFQVLVEDHGLFGGKELGEALYFISDTTSGANEKSVKVGSGTVNLRSSFTKSEGSINGTPGPDGLRPHRKSFLSRSRGATPS